VHKRGKARGCRAKIKEAAILSREERIKPKIESAKREWVGAGEKNNGPPFKSVARVGPFWEQLPEGVWEKWQIG